MSNVKQWAVAVGLCFLSALPSCYGNTENDILGKDKTIWHLTTN